MLKMLQNCKTHCFFVECENIIYCLALQIVKPTFPHLRMIWFLLYILCYDWGRPPRHPQPPHLHQSLRLLGVEHDQGSMEAIYNISQEHSLSQQTAGDLTTMGRSGAACSFN